MMMTYVSQSRVHLLDHLYNVVKLYVSTSKCSSQDCIQVRNRSLLYEKNLYMPDADCFAVVQIVMRIACVDSGRVVGVIYIFSSM